MIRLITPDDSTRVVALAVAAGLFPADEAGILDKMMADYFGGHFADGHRCVIDEEREPLAVAYYAPEVAADRTWDLTMIGVRRDVQGHGRGTALLRYVEDALRASGQRLLLVETSGLLSFAQTRMFYAKCGYEQEARIRDFYEAGDDKIVFRKVLTPNRP